MDLYCCCKQASSLLLLPLLFVLLFSMTVYLLVVGLPSLIMNIISWISLHYFTGKFDDNYFIKRANEALIKNEINPVAKLILECRLFKNFDILSIVDKLAVKGKNN